MSPELEEKDMKGEKGEGTGWNSLNKCEKQYSASNQQIIILTKTEVIEDPWNDKKPELTEWYNDNDENRLRF